MLYKPFYPIFKFLTFLRCMAKLLMIFTLFAHVYVWLRLCWPRFPNILLITNCMQDLLDEGIQTCVCVKSAKRWKVNIKLLFPPFIVLKRFVSLRRSIFSVCFLPALKCTLVFLFLTSCFTNFLVSFFSSLLLQRFFEQF